MSAGIQPVELIGSYCDLEKITNALLGGDAAAVRKEIDKAMRAFLKEEPDEDTLALFVNCLFVVLQYHVFYEFLDQAALVLNDTYADRAALRADWEAWQQGNALSDAEWMENADDAAKKRVLEAIGALYLTADDFDEFPVPEMKEPKWQKKTYGDFELVTIADAEITDDGGLFSAKDPTGKNYVLHDADGVTYHLSNVRRSELPENMTADGCGLFCADGWIDGYTSRQKREIEFEIYDGGVIFTYTTNGVNDAAGVNHPLWQPYTLWMQDRMNKRTAQQTAFLKKYL